MGNEGISSLRHRVRTKFGAEPASYLTSAGGSRTGNKAAGA